MKLTLAILAVFLSQLVAAQKEEMILYRLYSQIKNEKYVNQELGDEGQIREMIRILELKKK